MYFSEEDKKTVTLGSILDGIGRKLFIVLAAILIIIFIFGVSIMFLSTIPDNNIPTLTDGMYQVVKMWGVVAIGILIIAIISALYNYSHKIEITQCERME